MATPDADKIGNAVRPGNGEMVIVDACSQVTSVLIQLNRFLLPCYRSMPVRYFYYRFQHSWLKYTLCKLSNIWFFLLIRITMETTKPLLGMLAYSGVGNFECLYDKQYRWCSSAAATRMVQASYVDCWTHQSFSAHMQVSISFFLTFLKRSVVAFVPMRTDSIQLFSFWSFTTLTIFDSFLNIKGPNEYYFFLLSCQTPAS